MSSHDDFLEKLFPGHDSFLSLWFMNYNFNKLKSESENSTEEPAFSIIRTYRTFQDKHTSH